MRLDEVAQELYAAPPGEFVAARDEQARQAREAGDRALADKLRKLRRPTQSAWLVNLLWRERRELVEELLAVGAEFRGERLTRERLHELSDRRRELLHRLQADAQRLSTEAGVQLTPDRAREIEATLAAAVADPEAAEQVRGGRLVTALSYSGLGPELLFAQDSAGSAESAGVAEAAGSAESAGAAGAAGAARAAGHTPPSGETPAAAAAAVTAAERLVEERTGELRDAVRRRDDLVRRRDELQAELRRVEQRLGRVENELADAEREARAHSDSLEQARRELDAANPNGSPARTTGR